MGKHSDVKPLTTKGKIMRAAKHPATHVSFLLAIELIYKVGVDGILVSAFNAVHYL